MNTRKGSAWQFLGWGLEAWMLQGVEMCSLGLQTSQTAFSFLHLLVGNCIWPLMATLEVFAVWNQQLHSSGSTVTMSNKMTRHPTLKSRQLKCQPISSCYKDFLLFHINSNSKKKSAAWKLWFDMSEQCYCLAHRRRESAEKLIAAWNSSFIHSCQLHSAYFFFYPWANQKPVNCTRNKKLCDRFICAYHSKDNWAKRDSGKYYMGTHTCTVQQRWHQVRLLISLPAVKTAEELQFYYRYYGFLIFFFNSKRLFLRNTAFIVWWLCRLRLWLSVQSKPLAALLPKVNQWADEIYDFHKGDYCPFLKPFLTAKVTIP